jgi:hypothetical protein
MLNKTPTIRGGTQANTENSLINTCQFGLMSIRFPQQIISEIKLNCSKQNWAESVGPVKLIYTR